MIEKGIHIKDVIDQKFLIAFSQQCYQQMSDLSGTEFTAGQLSDLEQAACDLIDSLPQAYQDSFAVLDYGFYLHNRSMDQGVEDIWQEVIQEADAISPYYLLLGRVPGREGELKVEVKLGEIFGDCFSQEDQVQWVLNMNMEYQLDQDINFAKQLALINDLEEKIVNIDECCQNKSQGKSASADEVTLIVVFEEESNVRYLEDITLISPSPKMPKIHLNPKIEYSIPNVFCIESWYSASLSIKYKRTTNKERSRDRNDEYFLDRDSILGDNWNTFEIPEFRGGRAVLKLYDIGNISQIDECCRNDYVLDSFRFSIKGLNPSTKSVYEYIDQKNYEALYPFFKIFGTHECGANPKKLSDPLHQFNGYYAQHEHLWVDWDHYSRCPKSNGDPHYPNRSDGGFGIMQLTNEAPTAQELWSWKLSVDEAYGRLVGKVITVKNKLENELEVVNRWNEENLDTNNVEMKDITYSDIKWKFAPSPAYNSSNDISSYFSQTITGSNEMSLLDACTMLAYNGFDGKWVEPNQTGQTSQFYVNFLYLHRETEASKPEWRFSDNNKNYVKAMVKTYIPTR